MSEEQTTFKVTDRRLFNPDGSPRDLPEEAKAEEVVATPPPSTERVAEPTAVTGQEQEPASSKSEELPDELPDAEDPAGFANFLMSIATNAASALGMMEHPVSRQREVDLELGRHWIEVLGMLQRKTRGNLSPQEQQILEGLLADLRMQYVSLTNSASAKAPRGFTGRDIVGG
jgi:hypothetical protein